MHKKVKPAGKQISMLLLHLAVFAVATAASWYFYDKPLTGRWAYPWPAWTTAAWALAFLGHFCIVFTSYGDKGYDTYRQQQGKM